MTNETQKDSMLNKIAKNDLKAVVEMVSKHGISVTSLKNRLSQLATIEAKAKGEKRFLTELECHTHETIREGIAKELIHIIRNF